MGDMVKKMARQLRKKFGARIGLIESREWEPITRAALEACHFEELVTALRAITEHHERIYGNAAVLVEEIEDARAVLAKVEASHA